MTAIPKRLQQTPPLSRKDNPPRIGPKRKLSDWQVYEIRRAIRGGSSLRWLAARHKVSSKTIASAAYGERAYRNI